MLHKFLLQLKRGAIIFLKIVLSVVPKKRSLLLFTSWFGKKYADNSMYVFEYLLSHHDNLKCYWYCTDKMLYTELKKQGIPALYSKTFFAKWCQLRAFMLFSSVQLSEYNPYLLTRVTYVDLGHGHSIKDPGAIVRDEKLIKYNSLLKRWIKYYTIVCFDHLPFQQKRFSNLLENNTILKLGFARNDVFYDESLKGNKNISIKNIIKDKIVISYLPTHRSDGKEAIDICSIFDLDIIDSICEQNNAVFLIKKHFYHRNEESNLGNYKHIFDITRDLTIDTQVLLSDTNILISDYSACFIDFLLLDRPIVLYQYDYDSYINKERNILIPFKDIKISTYPKNKDELSNDLERILNNSLDDGYSNGRRAIKEEYFSNNISNHVREDVAGFILGVISSK